MTEITVKQINEYIYSLIGDYPVFEGEWHNDNKQWFDFVERKVESIDYLGCYDAEYDDQAPYQELTYAELAEYFNIPEDQIKIIT